MKKIVCRAWTFYPKTRRVERYIWKSYLDDNQDFIIYFHFLGFRAIQLGFHIDLAVKNLELHLPFCFIRIGWECKYYY